MKTTDFNDHWVNSFHHFASLIGSGPKNHYQPDLLLDCANGVGAMQFKVNLEKMTALFGEAMPLNVTIINDQASPDMLNENCGAEYVHKDVKFPSHYDGRVGVKCASFDGDADRLIYFYKVEGQETPVIIDGDK